MRAFFTTLPRLTALLDSSEIRYAVIGGFAVVIRVAVRASRVILAWALTLTMACGEPNDQPIRIPMASKVAVCPPAATKTDGSRTSPFVDLTTAISSVASGGRIALAAGSYSSSLALTKPLDLVGRCAAKVFLVGSSVAPTVKITATGVQVRGVTVTGGLTGVIVAGGGGAALNRVLVWKTGVSAVYVSGGAKLKLQDVVLSATQPGSDGTLGTGMLISQGSAVELLRVRVSANRLFAIMAMDANTKVQGQDLIVDGTVAAAGVVPQGLYATDGAQVSLHTARFVRNGGYQVLASGTTTQVVLQRCAIENSQPSDPKLSKGFGIAIGTGARLELYTIAHFRYQSRG